MKACRYALFIAIILLLFLATCCFSERTDTTSLFKTNEQEARLHYLAGETALKSGDTLTAIVEWEAALRLKPSSEYTSKRIADAAKKLSNDEYDAYAHMLNAADLLNQNKIDEAEKELSLASMCKEDSLMPQCLVALSNDLASRKMAAKVADVSQQMKIADAVKTAVAAVPKAPATMTSTTTSKKQTKSSTSTGAKKTKTLSNGQYMSPRPSYTYPTTKLTYVHGYYRKNGTYVRGHYVLARSRRSY